MNEKKYPALNLPVAPLKITEEDGVVKVFDPLRGKSVRLTPEEWVRQHFANWLMTSLGYPASMMRNEIGIELNGTKKRCDTVVFDRAGRPLIIVEYKAPEVSVTQDVFDQAVRYNMQLHAQYLIVSNGMNHYCCRIDYKGDTYHFIREIPAWSELTDGSLPDKLVQYSEN